MSKFRKRHTKVGAQPGTLVIPEEAKPPQIRVMRYSEGDLQEREIKRVDELRDCTEGPGVSWIDVQGIGDHDVLHQLQALFGIHPLGLEDVVNVPQRPKVEAYDEHLLFIARMVRMESLTYVDMEQVALFLGKHYVLTFQERYGDVFDPVRMRIRRGKGQIRKHGPDYLAYALLDTVIDAYYPVLERAGDFLEALEDEVVQAPTHENLRQIYHAKRELLTLRRSLWPQREAIQSLIRDESEFITDTVQVYLRDTYDHCVQLIDGIETYRELVGGLMDVYLSSVGNRQNEVMKVLTIMASIFIPLTFLVGIYGMNFEHIPELHYRWGYPILLVVMAGLAVGMLIYFRKLGWFGTPPERRDEG